MGVPVVSRQPPHDIEAERAIIGAALIRQQVVDNLKGLLDPSDFYQPRCQTIWDTMLRMHADGEVIDVVTVAAAVADHDVPHEFIMSMFTDTPAVSAHEQYAQIVVEKSRQRRLVAHFANLSDRAYVEPADVILAEADPGSDHLVAARTDEVKGLWRLEDFIDNARRVRDHEPWLIPHIFRPRWRVVIVAGEGVGKATLMRFIGLCAAAGRDPWMPSRRVDPCRVLFVDAENPDTTILQQTEVAHLDYDLVGEAVGRYHIWHREGGINLRDRRARAEFERVLQQTRPDIVFAGPFYKLFRRKGTEDLEQTTVEFLEVIDDFRVRFNFALMLEAHAPKGSGGYREMNPRGSAALMGWPEFGITLEAGGNQMPDDRALTLDVGRFRRDREIADWPTVLRRGQMNQRAAWDPWWRDGRNRMGFPMGNPL